MVRNRVCASYSHFYRNEGVLQLASNYKNSRVSYTKNTYSTCKSRRGFFSDRNKNGCHFLAITKLGSTQIIIAYRRWVDKLGRWVAK
jgi:hypothetical protein